MDNQQYYDLSTKDGLMAYLGTFPPHLIVDFIAQNDGDRILQDLAALGYQIQTQAAAPSVAQNDDEILFEESVGEATPETRSLRPLNAFMGFRSWYSKILPDAQQKDISAFITKLWEKDVRRNEWSLIAKVYSSIRDTVGKKNITLKNFLGHACPIMQIVSPEHYLKTFKWTVSVNEAGERTLHQDQATAMPVILNLSQDFPTTEMELLQAVLNDGFMPKHASMLMEKLNGNANGLMTTSRGSKMQEFVQALISDPTGTAAQILGSPTPVTVNTAEIEDLSMLNDSCILNENELTHYAFNMAHERQPSNASSGEGHPETDMSSGVEFLEQSDEAITSFVARGHIFYDPNAAMNYEHLTFQQGLPTNMNEIPVPNIYDAEFVQSDDAFNFMLAIDQHQGEHGIGQSEQLQEDLARSPSFQYF